MRQLIITILLAFVALAGSAQSKTDTAKKAPAPKREYKLDPDKVYHINLDLVLDDLGLLTAKPEDWKAIRSSPRLSAEQATNMEARADELRKMIIDQVRAVQAADFEKFKADTARASKIPVKK